MKKQNLNSILKEIANKVSPSKQELDSINTLVEGFLGKIQRKVKDLGFHAEVFVGGSFAKNTLIKKDQYDIDVFLRFDKKYENEELSELTERLLKGIKNVTLIHGSRDYFRVKLGNNIYIELVPVRKISKPEQAENVTDLSYSHVNYIKKKIKNQKILDDIRICKAFCFANNCYGAESYIGGFSGYALELLVYYYKGFLKFLRAMTKVRREKLIIDIEKLYKNKKQVMMDINTSKLASPIILIDPTYKQRNALAALTKETFEKFQEQAAKFLKTPSLKAFEIKKTDLEKIKKDAKAKGYEFILLEASTDRQEGDIAGSKLLKFYKHLASEISPSFNIKNKGFNYDKNKKARFFFVTKSKGEIIVNGPKLEDKENTLRFRKKHKSVFTRDGKILAREKIKDDIKAFIQAWKHKNKDKIREMGIIRLGVV
jgi:tRNA nucleotidyltransferase (CCA-adding enzyme)